MAVKIVVEGTDRVLFGEPGSKGDAWADESQAKARCDQANAKAKELGLKTRYEVVEA